MNRFLNLFNLVGVLALAVLCVLQWKTNRRLQLETNHLETRSIEQTAEMEERARTASAQESDLTALRASLESATEELRESSNQLARIERELKQSAADCNQLKSSITNWVSAVAARDERLAQANEQIKALAKDRNETVTKFNDLARRHNDLVKSWNEWQARLQQTNTTRKVQ